MDRMTRPGDVVRSRKGIYRMYYQDPDSNTKMRCMNLFDAQSYDDNVGNSKIDQRNEEFVFNMKELLEAVCADKL